MNRRSALDLSEIEDFAIEVDSEIDSALSTSFNWPNKADGSPANNPPPSIIVVIANYMTAGLIEERSYAQNEAGGPSPNPYGVGLTRRGRAMLDEICSGGKICFELEGMSPIAQAPNQQSSFQTVSGFSGRSQVNRKGCR